MRVRSQASGSGSGAKGWKRMAACLRVGLAAELCDRGVRFGTSQVAFERAAPLAHADDLGCHSTLYVPNAQGWYAYPVRTVRGALGTSRPAPPVRTQRGRLVRVAGTYPREAPGRTRQLSR